tara:strand:+ start:92 stop:1582 length:1491 start_codon:yes stop_codon:yes gene_type:complete
VHKFGLGHSFKLLRAPDCCGTRLLSMDSSDLALAADDGLGMLDLGMLTAGASGASGALGDCLSSFEVPEVPLFGESADLLSRGEASFADPLLELSRRRLLGTDEPAEWEPMYEAASLERPIYDSDAHKPEFEAECLRVLQNPFKAVLFEPPTAVQDAIARIRQKTQYEVKKVVRLQYPERFSMHRQFMRVYRIDETRWVYHGTTKTNAAIIAKVGFRNSASQRAKFGKGIYTASNVWEALAYAEPDAESFVQTFFVAALAQGPSRVGTENMSDFGVDEAERQILTTTNPEQTIFCAAYEDQLYAHYKITVRYCVEETLLPSAHSIVRMYHPAIWSRVKQNPAQQLALAAPPFAVLPPAPAPKQAPAPMPRAIPQATEITCHQQFRVHGRVKVVNTWRKYEFALNAVGTIEKIVKDGKVHFFVALDDASMRELVRIVNKPPLMSWHTNQSWLRCQLCHLEKVSAPAAAVSSAAPAAAHAATSGDPSDANGGSKRRKL